MNPGSITFQSVRSVQDVLDLCDGDALKRVYETVMELLRCIYDVIAAAVREIAKAFREFLDGIFRKVNPRSYHLYKHAKKARVRNKHKNRLLKWFEGKKE